VPVNKELLCRRPGGGCFRRKLEMEGGERAGE
jgi:hypothetical protein